MPRSVEGAATGEPLGRLAGDAGDRVEVAVVMEENEPVRCGQCCNENINRGRASVSAPLGQARLGVTSCPLGANVADDPRQRLEVVRQEPVVRRTARREQQFERDRRAGRDLVVGEQIVPAVGDAPAPMPRARVGEKPGQLGLAEAAELLGGGADAAVSADPVHQTSAGGEADDLVERAVDGLRERSCPEDLFRVGHLLSVDDQGSLVRFGYLLRHEEISYRRRLADTLD